MYIDILKFFDLTNIMKNMPLYIFTENTAVEIMKSTV